MEHRETTQDITVKLHAPTAGHLTAAELLLTWRAEANFFWVSVPGAIFGGFLDSQPGDGLLPSFSSRFNRGLPNFRESRPIVDQWGRPSIGSTSPGRCREPTRCLPFDAGRGRRLRGQMGWEIRHWGGGDGARARMWLIF